MSLEMKSTYTLTGRISDLQGTPLPGLTVYAYDKDPKTPDNPLGQPATTDAEGQYKITFTPADFVLYVENRGPDIVIRVYDGDALLGESPMYNNSPMQSTINLQVAYLRDDPNEPARLVYGMVRDAGDSPLAGITVKAFDLDLRQEQFLGDAQTNHNGYYEIRYFQQRFRKREKGNADLVVKADVAADQAPVTSPVLFNAPQSAEINLTIPVEVLAPLSLFQKIAHTLTPLLEGFAIEELEQDEQYQDLSFLSGETGFEQSLLARFVLAHRLAREALQPELWFALLGSRVYEYAADQSVEQQFTQLLSTLPSLSAAAVRKALLRGFNEREIPEALREYTTAWMEAFLEFSAQRLLIEHGQPTFVQWALKEANVTSKKKLETFIRLFNEHQSLTPELMNALEKDKVFNKTELADFRTSFQLASLTGGDFSVVKTIKQTLEVRQPQQIRNLAKISEAEWVKFVMEQHADGTLSLPVDVPSVDGEAILSNAETYGKILARRFRDAFPTAAFAGGLERALQRDGVRGLRYADDLRRFLDSHENFEILNTPIDDFLEKNSQREFRALARDDNFRLEMKAVQRVFKLNPSFEATDTLLADEVHSAQKVYRMGESEFVRRYSDQPGFTEESARIAWNRAADTYSTVLTLIGDFKAMEGDALPRVLQSSANNLALYPNWNNLFNMGDICECEDCRSVLSPAAYFADLLVFLRDRPSKIPNSTVKDILFQRRPDLGYLELNCENAQVPLPYIDVVCEVLEAVLGGGDIDVELRGLTSIPC